MFIKNKKKVVLSWVVFYNKFGQLRLQNRILTQQVVTFYKFV